MPNKQLNIEEVYSIAQNEFNNKNYINAIGHYSEIIGLSKKIRSKIKVEALFNRAFSFEQIGDQYLKLGKNLAYLTYATRFYQAAQNDYQMALKGVSQNSEVYVAIKQSLERLEKNISEMVRDGQWIDCNQLNKTIEQMARQKFTVLTTGNKACYWNTASIASELSRKLCSEALTSTDSQSDGNLSHEAICA